MQGVRDPVELAFLMASSPIWLPLYIVYSVVKGSVRGAQYVVKVVGAYKTKEEATTAARGAEAASPDASVVVMEATPESVIEQYGKNSANLRNSKYKNIMNKKTTNTMLKMENQVYKNTHQNALMNAAYGNNSENLLNKSEYNTFINGLAKEGLSEPYPTQNEYKAMTEEEKDQYLLNARQEKNGPSFNPYGNFGGGRRFKNKTKRRRNGRRTNTRR
jgi:hypothetical protein